MIAMANPAESCRLLSAKEVAETTGFTYQTIITAAREKRLPSYRVARSYRFKLEEVLEAMKKGAPDEA